MGFPGSRPARGALGRAASFAVAAALLLPTQGSAAAPSADLAPSSITPITPITPAASISDARTTGGRSWIVVLQPSALSGDGGSTQVRLDTTAGRAAARVRAQAADNAIDRLARVGEFQVSSRFQWAMQGFAARLTSGQVAALRHDPAVARVVPDTPVSVVADTWPSGVRRVNGPANETTGAPDTDVDIAVVDTGIGPVGGPSGAAAELNVVGGHDCRAGGDGSITDGHGHGTHVAGTIGARDNGVGVVGVAPGARLWAVRVFDSAGRGSTSTVICGIDWVAQWMVKHPGRPMVANMSLRGSDDYAGPTHCDANGRDGRDPEHQAICTATGAGAVFVVAAGNEHDDADNYIPARYDEVITVGAISDFDGEPGGLSSQSSISSCSPPNGTEKDDSFARYSNYGAAVDIVAPGTCIRSLAPGTGATIRTALMSGTSMATPHVTGALGRFLSTHPDVSGDTARRLLIASGSLGWASGSDPDHVAHPNHAVLRLVDAAALNADAAALVVWPGASVVNIGAATDHVTLPFELQRMGGLSGGVDLALSDLPTGITISDPASLSDVTGLRGTVDLAVGATATSGDHLVSLGQSGTGLTTLVTLRVDRVAPRIGSPWPRAVLRSGGTYDGGAAPIRVSWSVTDDGSGVGTVELQRQTRSWEHLVSGVGMTSASAPLGKGTASSYRVRATDRAGNAATSSVLTARLLVRDSSSPQIHWQGAWRTVTNAAATGKSTRAARSVDASASLAFDGVGVAIVAPRGPGRGKLAITIDGRSVGSVDLASGSIQPRRIVFASGPLTRGSHVIRIVSRKAGAQLDGLLILQ